MTQPTDGGEEWLEACEEYAERLTKWEQDFVESLREQWDRRGSLSERQLEILERIYAEKTP